MESFDALLIREGPMFEFAIPGAQSTTILVVAAPSPIGRIIVRKLMLGGSSVKEGDQEVEDMLPRSVEIVIGDAGDPSSLMAAVENCNKIIYCATARSTITGDLYRVDHQGVYNLTKASQDMLNCPKRLSLPLGSTLDRYEGLVLSVGGNGRSYVFISEGGPSADRSQSKLYFARFNTKVGFCRVSVPFSSFCPVKPDDPPLDPFLVHTMTIRFEPRTQRPAEGPSRTKQDLRSFKFLLEYIKALPTGQETDFVLVSCTGLGVEPNRRKQVIKANRAGEDSLRRSGPLKAHGGQCALKFDQGNRITQGISCADVADICVKTLHDSTARNKSFDVTDILFGFLCVVLSWEGTEILQLCEGLLRVCYQARKGYELVAHLPDKANNYLTPALSVLEKNT